MLTELFPTVILGFQSLETLNPVLERNKNAGISLQPLLAACNTITGYFQIT